MPSDAAKLRDPEYPNLRVEVIEGYRHPPPGCGAEIVNGELFVMPRPAPRHATAALGLTDAISPAFRRRRDGPGGWVILPEPELKLGPRPDLVQPDLAGWRRERLPAMPEEAAIDVVPDWVCEVMSPSTGRFDRFDKMPMYFRHGVGHAWLVDPAAKTLEVFRHTADGWLLVSSAGESEVVRAEPFDAIELGLGALWEW